MKKTMETIMDFLNTDVDKTTRFYLCTFTFSVLVAIVGTYVMWWLLNNCPDFIGVYVAYTVIMAMATIMCVVYTFVETM